MKMLSEVCGSVNNYFIRGSVYGKFTITDGIIQPSEFLQDGQFYRIVGSVFNDGVYQFASDFLTDEEFIGTVYPMAVPPDFLSLVEEIEEFCSQEQSKPSAYTSESFGGYSYTKATDDNGVPLTWQKVFANRLNRYRRIGGI